MLSQFSGSFRDSAHESCIKGAIRVRGGVLKSTLVVDNDTTVHVHTYTVAFSLSVLQSRSSVVSVSPITDAHALTHSQIISSWERNTGWRSW